MKKKQPAHYYKFTNDQYLDIAHSSSSSKDENKKQDSQFELQKYNKQSLVDIARTGIVITSPEGLVTHFTGMEILGIDQNGIESLSEQERKSLVTNAKDMLRQVGVKPEHADYILNYDQRYMSTLCVGADVMGEGMFKVDYDKYPVRTIFEVNKNGNVTSHTCLNFKNIDDLSQNVKDPRSIDMMQKIDFSKMQNGNLQDAASYKCMANFKLNVNKKYLDANSQEVKSEFDNYAGIVNKYNKMQVGLSGLNATRQKISEQQNLNIPNKSRKDAYEQILSTEVGQETIQCLTANLRGNTATKGVEQQNPTTRIKPGTINK